MEYRNRPQESRNGQSSSANNNTNRGRSSSRGARLNRLVIPTRGAYVTRNPEQATSSVQTRSAQRDLVPVRRIRPETRAASAAAAFANAGIRSDDNLRRIEQDGRRTNLRRAPAMPSLIQPSTSSSASSSSSSVSNDRSSAARTIETRLRHQRLHNIREMFHDRQQSALNRNEGGSSASSVARPSSAFHSALDQRRLQAFVDRNSGVTTRTRSRQNLNDDLNTSSSSSSSSNSSLVSISSASSEDIAIIEPPRRRRRLNTLSSSD